MRRLRVRAATVVTLAAVAALAGCTADAAERPRVRLPASPPAHSTPPVATPPVARPGVNPWPTRAEVGVPKGTRLTPTGPLRITRDNTVVDGHLVRQEISVEADNVTVRRTRLIGAGEWGIIQREGFSGLRVERSEVRGDGRHKMQVAILNYGGALTVRDSYLHTTTDGIDTPHGLIDHNIISGLKYFPGDHNDGIASPSGPASGRSLVIRRNVIANPLGQTSAVALFQDFGRQYHVTVERNLLAGGGYSVYGGAGRYGRPTDIRIVGNVFSRTIFPKGGYWGPVTAYDPRGQGNVWQNNTWPDGRPVQP
ncbi:hypothetical protein SAMN05421678_11118 [Actinopolymorpha cephalotaxi]|uniref:Right handed beta helix region n=1 Tax=Actinopolymorpha cephalotaxi TaxID=504797 RepID=A0A1I2WQ43_9ACTN|nr:hypothetical protein [Actinopolymorpha cephalotaxi]NYH85046.1 hypothetical protein [Actinopolymorpha cephalotaxi]SFH02759.1 hypothetical protein SAMN05421678_11118 [Actinopolymorpha cephalotaxi]